MHVPLSFLEMKSHTARRRSGNNNNNTFQTSLLNYETQKTLSFSFQLFCHQIYVELKVRKKRVGKMVCIWQKAVYKAAKHKYFMYK